jgi:ATP-binding cassette, subfamily B, bacterial
VKYSSGDAPRYCTSQPVTHSGDLNEAMQPKISLRETGLGMGRILRRFTNQIRKQRSLIVISFLALLAETVLRVLEPLPLKFIFDAVLLRDNQKYTSGFPWMDGLSPMVLLTVLTVGLVGIAALRGAMAYTSTAGMAIAASRIMTEVRSDLYSHLQRLSLSYHNKAKTGDLIARVTQDITRLREVTVIAILPLTTNALTLVGMIIVMFWLNVELALIAIAIFPLFVFSTTRITRRIREVSRVQRQREGAMAATAAEAIGAIKVVQALSLQDTLESSFSDYNRQSLKEDAKAQKLSAGMERTVEILVAIATSLVLWRGVQLAIQGTITAGDLIVFINYLKTAFKPMRMLAKYTGQIAKATASGDRIVDVLDTIPDVRDSRGVITAPQFRGMVQFENVSFTYTPDEKGTLRNVNFKVEPGQQVALVGASGGGKSTLISLLMRFYDPSEGKILIDGHDLREYSIDSLRGQMSIVLQESILFSTTIRENIAYGSLEATEADIEAAARLANAHEFIIDLPQGYDTVLGERGATLSGGQRQRIAIARAAIRQAPIIILDEPTTGLDNHSEFIVNQALARLTHGRTTFVVSHNLHAVEHLDQIFYIENGEILERGTHAELMEQRGKYAHLYQLQSNVHPIRGKTATSSSNRKFG